MVMVAFVVATRFSLTNKRKMPHDVSSFSCSFLLPNLSYLFCHQRQHHTHERMKRLIRSASSSSPCSLGVKRRWKEGTKKTNQIHRQDMTRGRMKGGWRRREGKSNNTHFLLSAYSSIVSCCAGHTFLLLSCNTLLFSPWVPTQYSLSLLLHKDHHCLCHLQTSPKSPAASILSETDKKAKTSESQRNKSDCVSDLETRKQGVLFFFVSQRDSNEE